MKTKLLVLATALFFTVTGLVAQNRQRLSAEERTKNETEALTKALELTAEQKQQVYDITLKFAKDRSAAMTSSGDLSREQRMEAFLKIQKQQTDSIKTVLTEGQQTKYDEFLKEQQNQFQGRAGGGNRGNR
ncbi:hypothetical protein [Viscerimonas tarda]